MSCRPTQADDDINNKPVSVREKLCQGTRSYTEGGDGEDTEERVTISQ